MKNSNWKCGSLVRAAVVGIGLLFIGAWTLHGQGLIILDEIVRAHGGDVIAPISVQMVGVVERNGKVEPFRLLATRDEQLRIEYGLDGKDTLVATQRVNFRDDGRNAQHMIVPPGFSQLDVTGLFLVEQLRDRAIRVDATDQWTMIEGVRARRIQISSERTERHRGTILVKDQADLYVNDSGLLTAISRNYYQGRPDQHTLTFVFSDYKRIDEILLPGRIQVFLNKKVQQTFVVTAYTFDLPIERTLFQPRSAQ